VDCLINLITAIEFFLHARESIRLRSSLVARNLHLSKYAEFKLLTVPEFLNFEFKLLTVPEFVPEFPEFLNFRFPVPTKEACSLVELKTPRIRQFSNSPWIGRFCHADVLQNNLGRLLDFSSDEIRCQTVSTAFLNWHD
jgi:hypothetical protein